MKNLCDKHPIVLKVFTIASVFWILKVFLSSLPYKFSNHPDTQYIFSTIGEWMSININNSLWKWFSSYGWYIVGSLELIVSLILLFAVWVLILKLLWFLKNKETPNYLFSLGGLWAMIIMMWAVFFHTQTPLWIEVINGWKSDWWSLFKAAVSIVFLWAMLFIIYFKSFKNKFLK